MRKQQRSLTELEDSRDSLMSFEEIAEVLRMKDWQVERIFNRAMAKLKHPKNARGLWDYKNIGDIAPLRNS